MKKVGCRELKNRQGHYMKRVRRGETLLVTARGKTIARLEPARDGSPGEITLDERLRELEAQGHLRLGTRPFEPFRPVRAKGKPASQMIIEDRG